MSLLTKMDSAIAAKDESAMNEIIHDEYKFTMHASGNILSKADVIKWAMSGDINKDKVRIIYENVGLLKFIKILINYISYTYFFIIFFFF